jgi:transposase InsO family protein
MPMSDIAQGPKEPTIREVAAELARLTHRVEALYFTHYNFCRQHGSLKKLTPAMAAGVTDHIWTIEELIAA